MSQEPARQELMLSSDRINKLIASLVREQAPAWLRLDSDLRVPLHHLRSDEGGLVLDGITRELPASLTLEWTGYNSLFSARAEPRTDEHGTLRLTAPGGIDRVQHRAFRRVLLSSQMVVRCRLASGASGAPEQLLALRDVSCEGLSAWLVAEAGAPAAPGQGCLLTVVRPDAPAIELCGEARSLGGAIGGAPFIGFRVRPASSQDGVAWLRFLERQQHPRVGTGPEGLLDVWPLYESAGYFSLSGKRPADFVERRAMFIEVTRRALEAPSVGMQAIWPQSGPPVATLSALRYYESAWLGFQMAKRSGPAPDGTPGRLVLREIHLSIYERIQRDPGARWIIGHTQVRPVWSRLCHHDLTARYVESGDAAIWRFRAVEVKAPPVAAPLAPEVTVGVASGEETAAVLHAFARQHPPPFIEALDLVPRRFDLQEVRRRWWVGGLERDRALLVARRGGEVLAAIVLELADEGLHLFRLLDHALPITLLPGGEACLGALLVAAHAWYRKHGRRAWVCYLDARDEPCGGPGLRDLGEADMCILSTARLPEFFEHVHEITTPRGADDLAEGAR